MNDRTLNGVYAILELIGSGGFAHVYLARDLRTRQLVAVKVLTEGAASDEALRRRFRREAELARTLTEPHVVRVLAVGRDGATDYLVLEYVHGSTLDQLVRQRGPLPVAEALNYADQILSALEAAHAAGIVHCDIKPHNIMVDAKGRVKVMDFGIAKQAARARTTLTEHGWGTPRFMSPEQILGEPLDGRSDLYTLGLTLYTLLAGRPPFDADSPGRVLDRQIRAAPPRLREFRRDVPPALERAIRRALEKQPAHRFPNARAFRVALAAARSGAPAPLSLATLPLPGGLRTMVALPRRTAALLAGAAALLAVILVAGLPQRDEAAVLSAPAGAVAAETDRSQAAVAGADTDSKPSPAERAWTATAAAIHDTWGSDWPETVRRLAEFRDRYPEHEAAREKHYAALVSAGRAALAAGRTEAGSNYLKDAQKIFPDRAEARAALLALTPPPSAQTEAGTLLTDTFDDPAAGRLPQYSDDPTRYTFLYDSGHYVIRKLQADDPDAPTAWLPGEYDDVTVEVDARIPGGLEGRAIGVGCRDGGPDGGSYRLVIRPDTGEFSIQRWHQGEGTLLAGWEAAPAIKRGDALNRIAFTCAGKTLTAQVNGAEIARVEDGKLKGGKLSLSAAAEPGRRAEARFDNLIVKQPAP